MAGSISTSGIGIIPTQVADAWVYNYDALDLCLTLNTYVAGDKAGTVDWDGFYECAYALHT